MKSIRAQLLDSLLLLVGVVALAMAGSVASFIYLGGSIDRILRYNYISVIAAQNMKESLERQDSAATFYLAGQVTKARGQYQANWPIFKKWDDIEAQNITEFGEQDMSNDLERGFPRYRRAVEKLLYAKPEIPPAQERAYYFHVLEPAFLALKQRAQDVLDVNQRAILRADSRAKTQARRASWMGFGAAGAVLILALAVTNRTLRAVVSPLRAFVRQAEQIGAGHLDQRIEVIRPVELATLADAFNSMTEKLQAAHRVQEARLQRAQRMSDAALESLYDPVIVTDATGAIVHFNRAAEELYGSEQKAIGKPVRVAIPDPALARAVESVFADCGSRPAEDPDSLVKARLAGEERSYRLRASPMLGREGDLLGAVAVLEDITRLRELDRLKTEFISVASHELRTPVTSLILAVQLLEEGAAGELTASQRQLVGVQRQDLDRLQRLLQDLLDIGKLEQGAQAPQFECVAVDDVVKAAMDSVSGQAREKNVTISMQSCTDLPPLWIDRTLIRRALVNLLDNAVRHSRENGQITVRTGIRGRAAAIEVEDNGYGIPAAYVGRIFERFVQTPGATRGGAGLGLSIARGIAQSHGGDITVTSELDKGSVFTITLPLVRKVDDDGAHSDS